jgi:tetratricopeptide (TPR) repeat protein
MEDRMKFSTVSGTLAALALAWSSAIHATPSDWGELHQRLDQALAERDPAALAGLGRGIAGSGLEPEPWRHYWTAYAAYRRGLFADDDRMREQAFGQCAEAAAAAMDAGESSGESQALRGACFSQLAGMGPTAGMRYGSRAASAIDTALADAPDNPRALLVAGTQDLYTPVQWGGDKERAVRRLQRALSRFEQNAAVGRDRPWSPTWGRVDVFGQLAIALHRLGRADEARAVLARARRSGLRSEWLAGIARRLQASD